jgi:hypothetical protein
MLRSLFTQPRGRGILGSLGSPYPASCIAAVQYLLADLGYAPFLRSASPLPGAVVCCHFCSMERYKAAIRREGQEEAWEGLCAAF